MQNKYLNVHAVYLMLLFTFCTLKKKSEDLLFLFYTFFKFTPFLLWPLGLIPTAGQLQQKTPWLPSGIFLFFLRGAPRQQDFSAAVRKTLFLHWAQKGTRAAETNLHGCTCRVHWVSSGFFYLEGSLIVWEQSLINVNEVLIAYCMKFFLLSISLENSLQTGLIHCAVFPVSTSPKWLLKQIAE